MARRVISSRVNTGFPLVSELLLTYSTEKVFSRVIANWSCIINWSQVVSGSLGSTTLVSPVCTLIVKPGKPFR